MNKVSYPTFSVFVNTTDSFEDCWLPFFKLFNCYWPEFKGNIYLNTENKTFSFEDLNIISIKNGLIKEAWSQCLDYALGVIEEENILYLQEDYFFNDFIKNKLLNEFYEKFIKLDCDCLHLTDQSTPGPFKQTNDDMILEIDKNAQYRISCQAAFWKKDVIHSYLRKHESAWHFEYYGTKRSSKKNDKFYIINTKQFGCDKTQIIPYIFTGIIRGKWNEQTVPLFDKHNIKINFEKRGLYKLGTRTTLLDKIKMRWKKNYVKTILLSGAELFLLKIKSLFEHSH